MDGGNSGRLKVSDGPLTATVPAGTYCTVKSAVSIIPEGAAAKDQPLIEVDVSPPLAPAMRDSGLISKTLPCGGSG